MKDILATGAILGLAATLLCAVASQGCRSTEQYEESQEVHVEAIH